MNLNFEHLHLFLEGMKISREQHAEENKSYEYGLNGRLYSRNGKLSYSSIKGTVSIYNNSYIIKYLGYFAFPEELIVFVKYDQERALEEGVALTQIILGEDIVLDIPFGSSQITLTDELSANATEEVTTTGTSTTEQIPDPIQDNYSCDDFVVQSIDLTDYYRLGGKDIPNYEICELGGVKLTPEYNKEYADAIIVLKKSGYSAFLENIVWLGNMNWDINRKITTVGIDESSYYKRIYFTDNLNPLRVVNLKDSNLNYRLAKEFDVQQETILLQPTIKTIEDNGSLKAMNVQYAYRLITDNGQITSFSPYTDMVAIVKDDDGYNFEGGDIEELTSKSVTIECPVISILFKEIQAIAIEYEADTIPTAIRNLGVKPIAEIVEFIHTGTESEFDETLTLKDITETRHIWTYCNDITNKNNKLIAGGLRNTPYGFQEKYFEDLFLFKGWDISGNTHNSLINCFPQTYKYFDPSNTDQNIFTKKILYKRFLFFGNVTLTLKNKLDPNASQSITFTSSSDQYINYTQEIWEWLESLDLSLFDDDLVIAQSGTSILFSSTSGILDLSNFYFETSVSQVLIDFDNEYGLLTPTVDTTRLVYGAQSVGFNKGTGVRISFEEKKEVVLTKSAELYESGPILELATPTLKKTFVKDEIYRMSIQFFKNGSPLFAIVLGDIKIPAIGDKKKYIDASGWAVTESATGLLEYIALLEGNTVYVNQSVIDDQLYAHRMEMRVEVRIPCEFKRYVDSYQIQYVERTEKNRTILAQGISAPLVRMTALENLTESIAISAPKLYNRWTLPFNGGPLYPIFGLQTYDGWENPSGTKVTDEDFNDLDVLNGNDGGGDSGEGPRRYRSRIITNRRMFYFDSPDIIHSKISAKRISIGSVEILAKINTDHSPTLIYSPGNDEDIKSPSKYFNTGIHAENLTYKDTSFSRKIRYKDLAGTEESKPYFVNISIFSNITLYPSSHEVESATDLLTRGEIVLGNALTGSNFQAVNAALSLYAQFAIIDSLLLRGQWGNKDEYTSGLEKGAQENSGYSTVFIRTEDDVFTNAFLASHFTNPIFLTSHTPSGSYYIPEFTPTVLDDATPDYDPGGEHLAPFTDAHAIINIKMNNVNTVYGGRTKYAFSKNVFIPLGKVIPIKGSTADNQSQIFSMQGDFYTSLYLRTKSDFSEIDLEAIEEKTMQQDDVTHNSEDDIIKDYNRGGAWAYGVILETEVESRLTSEYRFFKSEGSVSFNLPLDEFINEAYFKKNNLRVYSPVPYNFKDDPLMVNILSASKTKFSGDYIDAWTQFLVNEFYELEKNKGIITNVTTWQDEIYAIQEHESSKIFVDESEFVTTESGESISIRKGIGTTFTTHKKLSEFGTSIRRALCQGEVGFSFMDERKRSFVKFGESLSLKHEIQQKLHEYFEYNKIIDTEGYYDSVYKETNIRIRTEKGITYFLSYNELEQRFNGWMSYDNDIYMMFDERVFIPCCALQNVTVYCPVIFSDNTITIQVNTYFEYQIEATEDPVWFNATDLPTGVEVNQNTGLIYGIIATPGIYIIKAIAENEECSDTLIITVTANIAELVGTINGIATVTAFLKGLAPLLVGVSNGVATVTGVLTYAYSFIEGESDGIATVEGILIGTGNLIGVINGVAIVTAPFLTAVSPANAYSHGVATVTGTLTGLRLLYMEGEINGIAIVTGILFNHTTIGVINGVATVTGTLSMYVSIDSVTTVSGTLTAKGSLTGPSNVSMTVEGILTAIGTLLGESNGIATVTGTLSIISSINAVATVNGILTAIGELTGESDGVTSVIGDIPQPFEERLDSVLLGAENPYFYDPETGAYKELTIPGYFFGRDIAHTENKLWVMLNRTTPASTSKTTLKEYNITLMPFNAVWNRDIVIDAYTGDGLCAIDDTTLVIDTVFEGNEFNYPWVIQEVDISGGSPILTPKFNLPQRYLPGNDYSDQVEGDYIYTLSGKLIILSADGGDERILQYNYATGVLEIDASIAEVTRPFGLAVDNGELYMFDATANSRVWHILKESPYTKTYIEALTNIWVAGASQIPSVIDFELVPGIGGFASVTGTLTEA